MSIGPNTKIEWADHTFNPWIGCTKVSPGCEHCYAEELMDKRLGRAKWGTGAARIRTSANYWREPLRWASETSRPSRVFCASLADWLDPEVPIDWLVDLMDLVRRTPWHNWLLLTKRPELWSKRLSEAMVYDDQRTMLRGEIKRSDVALFIGGWLEGIAPWRGASHVPSNIWVGATIEDQKRADERIPRLLEIPARVRFLSCEPLLEPVKLEGLNGTCTMCVSYNCELDAPAGFLHSAPCNQKIHWVICGGETGSGARPMNESWAEALRVQCSSAHVPFFFKQLGGKTRPFGTTIYGKRYHELPNF